MTTKQKIIKEWLDITDKPSDNETVDLMVELDSDSEDFLEPEQEEKKPLTAKEKKLAREKKYEEHYEQVKVIKWWRSSQAKCAIPEYYLCFRNANTQYLSMGGIMWCKAEGLMAGIPDLTIIAQNKILFVEMKRSDKRPKTARSKGGLNEAQLEVFPKFEKCGFKPIVCYSGDEAIKCISDFTGLNDETK